MGCEDDASGIEEVRRGRTPVVLCQGPFENAEPTFAFQALGSGDEQGTSKYQEKCLDASRKAYEAVSSGARVWRARTSGYAIVPTRLSRTVTIRRALVHCV